MKAEMRWIGYTSLCWMLLTAEGQALAQRCPVDLQPTDESYGYRYRGGPNRCEGLYLSPVAGENLEILSFTIGRPAEASWRSRTLLITAPDLHGLGGTSSQQVVIVIGRALPLRVYYRLDITLPPKSSAEWPVDQVVIPAGLKPDDVGVVGLVKTSEGNVYVPLELSLPQLKTPPSAAEIVFRAPVDLDNFQWRLYSNGQIASWASKGAARAGDVIALPLNSLVRGATMTLEVAAKPVGAGYIQSRYEIFRP